jgi:peptidoglycan/LPS O-acetylase OafA/YrhL
MLFHVRVPPFSGGYVGVDIFFVISGFLITKLLLPDRNGRRLGLAEFYERRVRRILPALFAVIGVCFVPAWLLLFPDQFETFALSAIATILFVSNFFFRAQAIGYFFQPVELNPLLHTWSLAVEEQFYIVYPAFLFLILRLDRRKMVMAIGAAAIVSFAMAQWAIGSHVKAAFYMAPPRAWEFLIGALLAVDAVPALTTRMQREFATLIGALLLCWPIFTFTSNTAFPGFNALFPCLGAALIIHAGINGPSLMTRLLQTEPLPSIGRISYSLYLWHWPIIVFCRQYFGSTTLGPVITVSMIGASFLLAGMSWKFIEQPARNRRTLPKRTMYVFAGSTAALGLVLATAVLAETGFPSRLPPDASLAMTGARDRDPRFSHCLGLDVSQATADLGCRLGLPEPFPPTFVLWGDSHAAALIPAVDESATNLELAGVFLGQATCPPLEGVIVSGGLGNEGCHDFNDGVMDYVRTTASIDTVVIAARWAVYAEGTRYGYESQDHVLITSDRRAPPGQTGNLLVFTDALKRTVTAIEDSGKRVVLVGPIPEIGWNVPNTLAMTKMTGFQAPAAPTLADFLSRQKHVLNAIAGLPKGPRLAVIYPHERLCAGGSCRPANGAVPLYFDDDHLSVSGAKSISTLFDPALRESQPESTAIAHARTR